MEYNPFSLSGKTILVTGASSGIGRAIAIEASKMNGRVVISGRNEERLNETLGMLDGGNEHLSIVADISEPEKIEYVATNVPQLDGVVHCAGIGDRTLCRMIQEKQLDKVMSINFNAPVLLQRALLKYKKIKDFASIVFIASRAPFAPSVGNALYSASKGAIIAYANVLGLELAPRKIRVNSICPAMVWTDLIRRDAEITGTDFSIEEKKYPLGRYGQPNDIAYLTIYLLSDASSWMTGSAIDITGGVKTL